MQQVQMRSERLRQLYAGIDYGFVFDSRTDQDLAQGMPVALD